jgi:hypothetical protein
MTITTRVFACASVAVSLLLVAAPAKAIFTNVVFCAEGYGAYDDNWDNRPALANGTREDYFTDDKAKPLRGFHMTVSQGGTTRWSGYTGDGLGSAAVGCTSTFALNGLAPFNVSVMISTRAKSQTHFIDGIDKAGLDQGLHWVNRVVSFTIETTPTAPVTVSWMPTDSKTRHILLATNAVAFAAYRHYGGLAGGKFQVVVDSVADSCNQTVPSGYDERLDTVSGNSDRKFLIVHEIGHCILKYRKPEQIYYDGCAFVDQTCPANQGNASHSPASNELHNCAFLEGFAHFYATDVFNSHNSQQAVFNYYTNEFGLGAPSIDVPVVGTTDQSVNGSYPRNVLETVCNPAHRTDHATSIDWTRTLWRVHTSSVSFNAMMSWIDDADFGWGHASAHDALDWVAYWTGGNLWNSWNVASTEHGVDN